MAVIDEGYDSDPHEGFDVDFPEDDLDLDISEDDSASDASSDASQRDIPALTASAQSDSRQKVTRPYLTTFERTRIVGVRALQISMGAPCNPSRTQNVSAIDIAEAELYAGILPYTIGRKLPGNTSETWALCEFSNPELVTYCLCPNPFAFELYADPSSICAQPQC